MKKISDILRKKQVLYPLIALAGFVLGWLLFSPSSSPESAGEHMLKLITMICMERLMIWCRTNPVSGPAPCIRRFVRTNPANALSAVWT